jgi:hypothetical protein
MKRYLPLLPALALALAGCAPAPHRIEPQTVSSVPYQSYECVQLASELQRVDTQLTSLSEQQRRAATTDTVLVTTGIILVPAILFGLLATKNHKNEIARLKGQQEAMQEAQRSICV